MVIQIFCPPKFVYYYYYWCVCTSIEVVYLVYCCVSVGAHTVCTCAKSTRECQVPYSIILCLIFLRQGLTESEARLAATKPQ